MTDRELMQQVLDSLLDTIPSDELGAKIRKTAIETLRARLAQPEPKKSDVFSFLLGEGELDGVGFGDRHPTERGNYWWRKHLRAAITQPEPEPVAWQSRMRPDWEENGWTQWKDCPKEQADNFWEVPRLHDWVYEARALYTAPPQREWQGLTTAERKVLWMAANNMREYGELLEAKLMEKNQHD